MINSVEVPFLLGGGLSPVSAVAMRGFTLSWLVSTFNGVTKGMQ